MFRRIVLLGIWLSVSMLLKSQEKYAVDSTLTSIIESQTTAQSVNPAIIDELLNYGKRYLRVRYQFGGNGPNRFDCSGFTRHVFSKFGVDLVRSSADMARQVPAISKSSLQPGDLVFYQGRRLNGRVGHVGIVTEVFENGQFRFIHASVQEGVTITNSTAPYYAGRFVSAGRVPGLVPEIITTSAEEYRHLGADPDTTRLQPEVPVKVERVIPARYHVVRQGENLSVISRRYGVSVAQIKRLNNLKSDVLQIRQRLLIQPARTVVE